MGGNPPRAAFEQLHAVQGFQPRNMLADGGRGHAQGTRGGVHRAVFDNGGKGEQGFGFGHIGWCGEGAGNIYIDFPKVLSELANQPVICSWCVWRGY